MTGLVAVVETWRPVVGWEGLYSVSDLGRVRREAQTRGARAGHVLSATSMKSGYRHVYLRREGKCHTRYVHRLVLEAFAGPCPEGLGCRHLDGDPGNNQVTNLAWGTRHENAVDRIRHGRTAKGEKNPNVKLTADQVREIRALRAAGWPCGRLAARFPVGVQTIWKVVKRQRWRHV